MRRQRCPARRTHDEVKCPIFRAKQTATMIARHPDYPGKEQVVAECLDEIEPRWRQGELSLEQRFQLNAVLMRKPQSEPWRPQSKTDGLCTSTTSSTGPGRRNDPPRDRRRSPRYPTVANGLSWLVRGDGPMSPRRDYSTSAARGPSSSPERCPTRVSRRGFAWTSRRDGMGQGEHRTPCRDPQGRTGVLGALPQGILQAATQSAPSGVTVSRGFADGYWR